MKAKNVYKAQLKYKGRDFMDGFYTKQQMLDYLKIFPNDTKKEFSWNILGEATKVVSISNSKKDMTLIRVENDSWIREEKKADFMGKTIFESERGIRDFEVENYCFNYSGRSDYRLWKGYVLKKSIKPTYNNFNHCILSN